MIREINLDRFNDLYFTPDGRRVNDLTATRTLSEHERSPYEQQLRQTAIVHDGLDDDADFSTFIPASIQTSGDIHAYARYMRSRFASKKD